MELKPYIGPHPTDHTLTEYYLKSEADKVIADLIEKNKRLAHKDIIMASETIKEVFKELRHHKYKRCLGKAEWCASRSASWCLDPADEQLHKSEFYDKWKHRWLALAEKFKLNRTKSAKEKQYESN